MSKATGFTLLELLIVVVIIGVLGLIVTPNLLGFADKAKIAVIKTNMASAATSLQSKLLLYDVNPDDAARESAEELQNSGTPDNPDDDPKNPLAAKECSPKECPAFQYGFSNNNPGVVMLESDDQNETVKISAFDKNGNAVVGSKIVKSPNATDTTPINNSNSTSSQPSTSTDQQYSNSIDEFPVTQ